MGKGKKIKKDPRQEEGRTGASVLSVLKILLAMYLVTGALLLALAALLYKMHLSEGAVSIGIVVIYVASGFIGGFLAGKTMRSRRFLWGMAMGGCYFLVLVIGSVAFQRGVSMDLARAVTTFALCAASGMAGGMAS